MKKNETNFSKVLNKTLKKKPLKKISLLLSLGLLSSCGQTVDNPHEILFTEEWNASWSEEWLEDWNGREGNIPAIDSGGLSGDSEDLRHWDVDFSQETLSTTEGIDIDLTQLSSSMVYGVVFQMLFFPEEYVGKTVRMAGEYHVYFNPVTEKEYNATIVEDALACCTQGLEFALIDDEYPELGEEIVVTGVLGVYEEMGYENIHLVDAVWLKE